MGDFAFVSLMKKGGDDGIIRRWLDVVGKEPSRERRGNLTLAVVFAERTGCTAAWKKALEGFDVIESTIVNEWKAEAARRAELKATIAAVQPGAGYRDQPGCSVLPVGP